MLDLMGFKRSNQENYGINSPDSMELMGIYGGFHLDLMADHSWDLKWDLPNLGNELT